jgi:hypothetical protein
MSIPKSAHDKKGTCKVAEDAWLWRRKNLRRLFTDANHLYMSEGRSNTSLLDRNKRYLRAGAG